MRASIAVALLLCVFACGEAPPPAWEAANPIQPLPEPPLGVTHTWDELENPPTPETVRLGRWLYYDTRLSADNTIACVTCHKPENAFSESEPVSTGIHGQKGGRKAPTFINAAWALLPHTFWDGRAANLEEQALGPVANPIEMGNTPEKMIDTLSNIGGYAPYFEEAFGSPEITTDRVAKAIADYERTRMSGNSPYDRWKAGDESAVSDEVKLGDQLFFDKAGCNQCHLGYNFTDTLFHNLGVGWDPEAEEFADLGRYVVTEVDTDRGAFKTPTVREVTKRAPYMHDGSVETLREVVELYNRGGEKNPYLDPKIQPLNLTEEEVDALVAMMVALEGEGYEDTPPTAFPQ
ncbi:MAG TPA: cytochrome c peroxidase [Vicinamibacteria bacterium]|nr:cytochrome c peroxidase [Vicinamibacteria bacterium]